jgi:hypothetical protein
MAMRNHVSESHAITFEAFESAYGSTMSVMTQFMCQICPSAMPFDAAFVAEHLNQTHQMTPEYYQALYLIKKDGDHQVNTTQVEPHLPDDLILDDVDAFIAQQSQTGLVKNELIQWELN